jgi:hypothetical protein
MSFINKTMTEITFLLHSCKNEIELIYITCMNNDRLAMHMPDVRYGP